MTIEPMPGTEVEGPYGRAEPFAPTASPATIAAYLVTAPAYHPLWSQYMLAVITLAPVPGVPEAHLQFPGATHELIVVALDPTKGVHTAAALADPGTHPGHLRPTNVVHQFEATDDEMKQVAWLACRAIVHGRLNPETADAPDRIREGWLAACVKTLAHLRGEEHSP